MNRYEDIDMILINMKEYLNEYELDELGECGTPWFFSIMII